MKTLHRFSCFCGLWLMASAAPAANQPNILVFLSDDHSAPHVGCYGNPDVHTPNLDRFAAEGMRFDRAYVTAPQCVPSRASIMTGRSPVRIDMTRFSAPLPMEITTYPEILRKAGYYTGVAGRGYHLDGARKGQASAAIFDKYQLQTFSRRLDSVQQASGKTGPEFNDNVIEQLRGFLDSAPKDKPFFLQLCTSDPHRGFDREKIPAPRDPAKLKLPAWFPDTPEVRRDLADYYDEISRMDETFGRALAELNKRGTGSNTFIIFMGDNGASQLRGKGTLYEFGIHVPLLVRWPGVIKAGQSAELISGEDIGPTALEAAGLKAPEDWTGKSFLPLLQGRPFKGREMIFAERGPHGTGLPGSTSAFDLGRVIVTKTHKLIYNALFRQPYTPVDFNNGPAWRSTVASAEAGKVPPSLVPLYTSQERPMFELYDLVKDPNELENLAGKNASREIEQNLKAALQEWMILERDYLPLPLTGDGAGRGKRK